MRYSVAIHKDKDSCYGVSVPDIPGCFSAGESLDEALKSVEEAISSHLEILAEDGELAPTPSLVDDFVNDDQYAGATWAYVEIDVSAFLGRSEKASVTLPKLLITQIDEVVKKGGAKSRSAFLADSAIKSLGR